MGLSSSKQKQTTNQTQTGTVNSTSTPVMAPWLSDLYQGFAGQIGQFAQVDPSTLVAGPSDLQNQAFANAGNLGGWQQGLEAAMTAAQNAGNPVPVATYDAPQLGSAQTVDAPTLGNAQQAEAQGYTAAQAEAARLAALMQGTATEADWHSILDNGGIERYVSPHLGALVDANLDVFDDMAGRQQAQQAAAAARNGAFGGSRYGIAEAQLASDLTRGRALTAAELRDNAYRFGAGLAQFDTGQRNDTERFNSNLLTQTSLANAQMGNQHNQYQAGLQNTVNLANAGFQNDASAFGANAQNQASMFNAGQANQFALSQAELEQAANLFNAGQGNNFALNQAALDAQAGQFNAGQTNAMGQFNAGQGLAAAGLMGNLAQAGGNLAQGDVALQGQLGAMQQGLNQAQLLAPLAQLQALAGLYGSIPYQGFTGQNTQGQTTGTLQGTTTTTSQNSLFDHILQAARAAAAFA